MRKDTVQNFSQGQGDRLDLRGLREHDLFKGGITAETKWTFLEAKGAAFTSSKGQARYTRDGGNTTADDRNDYT